MNICLYGASSALIEKSHITETELLGEKIAERGHTLVFGGGANGLMGAAARGAHKKAGKIIGIAPTFFQVDGVLFEHCTEFIYTENMRQRKKLLEDKSDAFIVAPGGLGTFDELFEILTLKQLGQHQKPVAILNLNGYYDCLYKMLENAAEHKFMTEECLKLAPLFDNLDELIKYIEDYRPEDYDFNLMKKVGK